MKQETDLADKEERARKLAKITEELGWYIFSISQNLNKLSGVTDRLVDTLDTIRSAANDLEDIFTELETITKKINPKNERTKS